MAIWTSDQVFNTISIGGIASAGLTGAQQLPRATEVRGLVKVHRFSVEQATPHPMPGDPAGAIALGDSIILALLKPIERIYMIRVFFTALGNTDTALSLGKIDPNNAANTDLSHYYLTAPVVSPGFIDAITNMTEQVGVDPQGDQSVGNQPPEFGSADIQIVATITGTGTISAVGSFQGFIFAVEEGN